MMMGFGLLFPVLAIAAVAYAGGWRPRSLQASQPGIPPDTDSSNDVMDILRERYARGEVTKEQYEEMRLTLKP